MLKKDHLALGHFLLETSDCAGLRQHRHAFLLGCVEPDYNIASYLRGMREHRKFRGHNAENSLTHIKKCLSGFQADGLRSTWDYFTLGTMLHYAADAFTGPHNAFWEGSLVQHARYERSLHELFTRELNARGAAAEDIAALSLQRYFEGSHTGYRDAQRGMKTDCSYIISVCKTMLSGCLRYAQAPAERAIILKEVDFYEGAYHHGLVQAGH